LLKAPQVRLRPTLPQRAPPGREPLVERPDPPPEGQDLRPGEHEAGRSQKQ